MNPGRGHDVMELETDEQLRTGQVEFDRRVNSINGWQAYNVVKHGGRRVAEDTKVFDPSAVVTVETAGGTVERQVEEILLTPQMQGGC